MLWILLLGAAVVHCNALLPSSAWNWAPHRSLFFPRGRVDWSLHVRSPRPGPRRLPFQKKQPTTPINERIVAETVRLIEPSTEGSGGEAMTGVFSLEEARRRAQEQGLDLVLISADADPPVCKIVDYGKHSYAMEKKKKTAQKNQSKEDMKELKLSPEINQHDFDFKVRAAQKFITAGDRVGSARDFLPILHAIPWNTIFTRNAFMLCRFDWSWIFEAVKWRTPRTAAICCSGSCR